MSDVPSWNTIERPLLEATALLCSQGEAPDDKQLAGMLEPPLDAETIRAALARLIKEGLVSGNPIGAWQASVPVRVVNLRITSAGLRALRRP